MSRVAMILKHYRKSRGWTGRRMMKQLNISQAHYSKIEAGHIEPSAEITFRILDLVLPEVRLTLLKAEAEAESFLARFA